MFSFPSHIFQLYFQDNRSSSGSLADSANNINWTAYSYEYGLLFYIIIIIIIILLLYIFSLFYFSADIFPKAHIPKAHIGTRAERKPITGCYHRSAVYIPSHTPIEASHSLPLDPCSVHPLDNSVRKLNAFHNFYSHPLHTLTIYEKLLSIVVMIGASTT